MLTMIRVLQLLLTLFTLTCAHDEPYFSAYQNFSVYKLFPNDKSQFHEIEGLAQLFTSNIDFWSELSYPRPWFDIMVSPQVRKEFEQKLNQLGIGFKLKIDDVSTYIHAQMDSNAGHRKRSVSFDYNKYHDFNEINAWMDSFAKHYARHVKIFEIAKSFEGRPVRAFKISTTSPSKNQKETKPAIWIDAGIHAREWISVSTVVYISHLLLSKYNIDEYVTEILNKFDFYVLPVFNVDGYEYSWTTRRLWRKSRSRWPLTSCVGTDLNRNWNFDWCAQEGASKDPCSETYCGPYAFSEPEAKGVAEFLVQNNDHIVSAVSLHSYSQLWLSPWSTLEDQPPDFELQDTGSRIATEALASMFKTRYYHGSTFSILYKASGVSIDYIYGVANITFSYVVELRDAGKYGFLLPASQIKHTALETFEGVKALSFYLMNFIQNGNSNNSSSNITSLDYNYKNNNKNVNVVKYHYPISKKHKKMKNSSSTAKFKPMCWLIFYLISFVKCFVK